MIIDSLVRKKPIRLYSTNTKKRFTYFLYIFEVQKMRRQKFAQLFKSIMDTLSLRTFILKTVHKTLKQNFQILILILLHNSPQLFLSFQIAEDSRIYRYFSLK